MKYTFETHHRKLLVDTMTPVNMYLKIRDGYPNSILLESSDYGVNDNSVAYICFNPIAEIQTPKSYPSDELSRWDNQRTQAGRKREWPTIVAVLRNSFRQIFKAIDLLQMGCLVSLLMMQFSILRIFGFQTKIKNYLFHNCAMLFSECDCHQCFQ